MLFIKSISKVETPSSKEINKAKFEVPSNTATQSSSYSKPSKSESEVTRESEEISDQEWKEIMAFLNSLEEMVQNENQDNGSKEVPVKQNNLKEENSMKEDPKSQEEIKLREACRAARKELTSIIQERVEVQLQLSKVFEAFADIGTFPNDKLWEKYQTDPETLSQEELELCRHKVERNRLEKELERLRQKMNYLSSLAQEARDKRDIVAKALKEVLQSKRQ